MHPKILYLSTQMAQKKAFQPIELQLGRCKMCEPIKFGSVTAVRKKLKSGWVAQRSEGHF